MKGAQTGHCLPSRNASSPKSGFRRLSLFGSVSSIEHRANLNSSTFTIYRSMAQQLDIFRSDFETFHAPSTVRQTSRRWTVDGKDTVEYTKKSARLISTPIEQNDREVCALLLSEKLAKRIREALCITQEFRLYRNEVKEQNETINARQIDCDAWASSIKYSIQLLKEEIKRTGKASRDQRLELETLLKEERRVQKNDEDLQKARKKMKDVLSSGLEKWIKAWMEVDRMLNVVWTSADIIKQPQLATLRITRSSQSPPPDFRRPEQPPRTNASRPRDRGRDHDQIEHAGSRNRDSSRDQRRRSNRP
jgi:vacuolar-type H+-ATPase subunit I/STV1